MYKELVTMYKKGEVDFKDMIAFDMDAYISLGPNHKNSYAYFNNIHFLNHVNVKESNRFMPNVFAENLEEEAIRYSEKIEEFGGLDISVTGVGDNGHICFNEPGSYLLAKYHIANLHEETIKANSRFFNDISEVPIQAFTLGLEEVMKCKTFLVIASGKKKAPILGKMFKNDHIYSEYPVTFLRMHPNCIFLLDEDAASEI
jgi:glucosamine-6-phosphate deaminase